MIGFLAKLRRLLNRRDKLNLLVILALMILGSLVEVVGVGAIPVFIAFLTQPDQLAQYPLLQSTLDVVGITDSTQLVLWGSVALLLLFVIKNGYLVFVQYVRTRFVSGRRSTLTIRLFTEYMYAPYPFHLNRNSSELIRNAYLEVNAVVTALSQLLSIFLDALTITAIFALLLIVEPVVSVVTILTLGTASTLFLYRIRRSVKERGLQERERRRETVKTITEGLGILKEIKVLGRESFFTKRFTKTARGLADNQRYVAFVNYVPRAMIETVAVAGILAIVVIFLFEGRDVETAMPLLALFGMAVMKLMPAFRDLVSNMTTIRFNSISVEPIYADLSELAQMRQKGAESDTVVLHHAVGSSRKGAGKGGQQNPPLRLERAIRLENLAFHYPEAKVNVIDGITLIIEKGAEVAFVGPSGAGKTTLVDLILGLITPQMGGIYVDGRNIRENMFGWRQNIGYVPQVIYLTDDSIRRNIAVGLQDRDIDEEALWNAVHTAQLDGFVGGLPEGLETVIGERGVRISGGQRQRIGIARALYNDPEILIMDEATASLDNSTENVIIASLEQLKRRRTIIMIAHRLTTVRGCDVLHFMKDGKVEASGDYKELLAVSPEFKVMAGA